MTENVKRPNLSTVPENKPRPNAPKASPASNVAEGANTRQSGLFVLPESSQVTAQPSSAPPVPVQEAPAKPAPKANAKPKPKPAAKPSQEANSAPKKKPAPNADAKPKPKPAAKADGKPNPDKPGGPKPAPKGKPKAGPAKAGPKAKPKPAPKPEAAAKPVPPTASPAYARGRHHLIILSFILMVIAPVAVAGWYLWTRSADQYVSELGFTVRREEAASAFDVLGSLSNLSSAGSSDADVLYEYIQSQEMVSLIDQELDLRRLYSVHEDIDPIFSFASDGSIEDLVAYWRRMVQVSYDPGSGMLELFVFAFEPDTAKLIAEEILKNSSRVINEISAVAREDTIRYAREDLEVAQSRLKDAREALTAFRSKTRIVDPNAALQAQMGLLTTLQQQLASALIDLDLLRQTTQSRDPRIAQAELRIEVIQKRIEEERNKFSQTGTGGDDGQDYPTLVAEFERLTVDREFAEQTYTAALSSFSAARAEAERQSRYLATYVQPTLAETPGYPRRALLLGLILLFFTLAWAILVLVYYSLRDRQ